MAQPGPSAVAARPEPAGPDGRADRPTRLRRLILRLLPGLVLLVVAAVCLHAGDVRWRAIATFAAYVLLGLTLPGTLLWRALGPTLRWRVEELAAGTAVGYAVEAAGRIALSAAGLPGASPYVPLAIIAAFAAVPRLRRYWRSAAAPVPSGIAWAYAAIVGGLFFWLVWSFFGSQPLTWPDGGQPYVDLTYLLAIAGDVANHWPPQFPYVRGEPLQYHWFYAAHLAAAHAASGIDLPILLFRLAMLPMIAVLVVGTGALATRLSGRAWAGPLAGFLGWVVTDLTLQRLAETASTSASPVGSLMGAIMWWSPTQTYSAVLLLAAAILAVDVVRRRGRAGHWVLLVLLLAICAGAKGSALPVLIGAVGAVVGFATLGALLHGPTDRARWRAVLPAAGLLALLGAVFVVTLVVLYGGHTYGIRFKPFGMADTSLLGRDFSGSWPGDPGPLRERFITGLAVLSFATPWLGALLLARRGPRRDPASWLVPGAATVGLATMVLLYHPGQSQLDFIRSALPLLAAAGAWGIADALTGLHRVALQAIAALAVGLGVGLLLAWRIGLPLATWSPGLMVRTVLAPYAITVAALAVLAAGWAAGWAIRTRRRPGPALLVAAAVFALAFAGAGATRMVAQVGYETHLVASGQPLVTVVAAGPEQRAAVWLREHSSPRTVIATNVQCVNRLPPTSPGCSNLAYWVTAYTERRAVLNGWGYTATAARLDAARPPNSGYVSFLPFWDTALLDQLVTALAEPTPARGQALRRDYGVGWIYADARYPGLSPRLPAVLPLRHRDGPVSIYRIPRPR